MTPYLGVFVFVISVVALIYIFLVSPRVTNPADMELLKCDYAHRGLWSKRYPENSLAAFEIAARNGYGIELDVRLTKDKRVVVFHDDDLRRMCGVSRKVSELTLRELKTLRLRNTGLTIPTFEEALKQIHGRVPILVEIKGEKPDPALCGRVAYLLDTYRGPFCVESFSPFILAWFKKHRPSYARGQLVTKPDLSGRKWGALLSFVLQKMLTNFISRPDFIAINGKYRHSLGFLLCTRVFHAPGFIWTVSSEDCYSSVTRGGYHAIFEKFTPKGKQT